VFYIFAEIARKVEGTDLLQPYTAHNKYDYSSVKHRGYNV